MLKIYLSSLNSPYFLLVYYHLILHKGVHGLHTDSEVIYTQAARERCYVNIGVLKICFLNYMFWNFWSKSLKNTCEESSFLVKLQALSLQLNKKWTSSQVFFKDFDQKFTNTFFTEHLLVTACVYTSLFTYILYFYLSVIVMFT